MTDDTNGTHGATVAVDPETDRTIGCIARSNSHVDYVVKAYREGERADPPTPDDHAFGQPVYAERTVDGDPHAVIGVVYDSRLVDPAQGSDGPRLSVPDQELLVPGYVEEKRTLLGVALLGHARLDDGRFAAVHQRMPRWTLDVDDPIRRLAPAGVRAFHRAGGSNAVDGANDAPAGAGGPEPAGVRMRYVDRLLSTADRFGPEVVLELVDRVRAALDDGDPAGAADPTEAGAAGADPEDVLSVIERTVRWRASTDRGVVR
jgi:hypothetical protein